MDDEQQAASGWLIALSLGVVFFALVAWYIENQMDPNDRR